MSPSARDFLLAAGAVAAVAAALSLRAPGMLREADDLTARIESRGAAAALCGSTMPGTGELAAVLAAMEALAGRAGPVCAPDGYLRFAAS